MSERNQNYFRSFYDNEWERVATGSIVLSDGDWNRLENKAIDSEEEIIENSSE